MRRTCSCRRLPEAGARDSARGGGGGQCTQSGHISAFVRNTTLPSGKAASRYNPLTESKYSLPQPRAGCYRTSRMFASWTKGSALVCWVCRDRAPQASGSHSRNVLFLSPGGWRPRSRCLSNWFLLRAKGEIGPVHLVGTFPIQQS